MNNAQLGTITGYIIGFLLGLVIQYFLIKYAVYAGLKRYHESQPDNRGYETMRDAVAAGMLSYDEQVKETNKKG